MDTIYLYCITRKGLSIPDTLRGARNTQLEVITWERLAGVCSVLPLDPKADPSFTLQDLLLHKEIIEYVHASFPVIPMRFPTTLKGREKVVELLQRHYSRLEETLKRLEDKVEVSLRIIPVAENHPPNAPKTTARDGIDYLRQKKQVHEGHKLNLKAKEVSQVLGQRLRPLVIESQIESNRSMYSIYYLLGRNKLEEFEKVLGEIKGEIPGKVLYSGPWPPYSFVPEFLEV